RLTQDGWRVAAGPGSSGSPAADIDKLQRAVELHMHSRWRERLAQAGPLEAGTGFDVEHRAMPVAHDRAAIGIQVGVLAPGKRRAVDVRTRIQPRADMASPAHHEDRVASGA